MTPNEIDYQEKTISTNDILDNCPMCDFDISNKDSLSTLRS
jgi:hypothetical protein